MHTIPELVIFDDARDREMLECAREAALRNGWEPEVFTNLQQAAEAIGFFTRAIITATGRRYEGVKNYSCMTPLEASDLLEIPRAVIVDEGVRTASITREGMPDIVLPRSRPGDVVRLFSVWLEQIQTS